MAIDAIKLGELDIIKKLNDRLEATEQKINDVFSGYNIPDDITDDKIKLTYALSEIGDDQTARNEVRTKFENAQKEVELNNKSIEEDFVNMTNLGNSRIEKYSNKLKVLEEEFKIKKAEEKNIKANITTIDVEITILNDEKSVIQGVDGKGGKIAEEKSKSVKSKDEAKKIAKDIESIDAKIKEIDVKIEKLNEANKTTNDPEELRKNAAEIAVLQGDKLALMSDRDIASASRKEKQKEQKEHEDNITSLEDDIRNINSKIGVKSAEKNILENELRLMPVVGDELKQAIEKFQTKKQEYMDTVDSVEKQLNDRGIDVKAVRLVVDEPIIVEDNTILEENESIVNEEQQPIIGEDEAIVNEEQPIIGEDEAIVNEEQPIVEQQQNKRKNQKENRYEQNYAPQNNGQFVQQDNSSPEQNLPVVTPEQKKSKNYEYITGYGDNGVGLSSDDRLKRIQSELGGRDYEAMVKAFEELKKSPVSLTSEEKKKIKEMMRLDKKNLAQNVKEIDVDKLDGLLKSVGVNMNPAELKALHKNSYEGQSMSAKLNNGFKDYGEATYGILDGFTQMSEKSHTKWEQAVKSYEDNKKNMSEDEIKDFEKYILTPIKFGTLHEQSKQVCKGPFMKMFSRSENKKVNDIRSAIARAELPKGEELDSRQRSKDFTDILRDQTEPNPPLNERQNISEDELNRNNR